MLFFVSVNGRHSDDPPCAYNTLPSYPTRTRVLQAAKFDKHIVSTRIRAGRSIEGLALPPSTDRKQRRKVEPPRRRLLLTACIPSNRRPGACQAPLQIPPRPSSLSLLPHRALSFSLSLLLWPGGVAPHGCLVRDGDGPPGHVLPPRCHDQEGGYGSTARVCVLRCSGAFACRPSNSPTH